MPINDFSEYPMSWRPQRSAFPEGPYYLALAALLERERQMQRAILNIKRRFGKNAILKGMNLQEGAMTRERNRQIGGHKA